MMVMSPRVRMAAWSLALAIGACGEAPAEDGPASYPFETGAEMRPGENCRSCHGAPSSRYPEAPPWSIAGTVFEGPQSDVGVAGVTVTVRDAMGRALSTTTNRVGNFYLSAPIQAPYFVSLGRGEVSVTMAVPPPAGGCNACHAKSPGGGAPGRLFLPGPGAFASRAECDAEHTVTVVDTAYDCAPYRCECQEGHCLVRCGRRKRLCRK